jgi:hypothetical protein
MHVQHRLLASVVSGVSFGGMINARDLNCLVVVFVQNSLSDGQGWMLDFKAH